MDTGDAIEIKDNVQESNMDTGDAIEIKVYAHKVWHPRVYDEKLMSLLKYSN